MPDVASYWKAVATLPVDRPAALERLESEFRAGSVPRRLDGPYRGRLVATTMGRGLDALVGGLSRLWMPWKGKTFDAGRSEGRNRFTTGVTPAIRILWPAYRDVRPDGRGRTTAFRFVTHSGPSAIFPEVEVLRIDYAIPDSPWLIGRILDELVRIDEGVYLGQALVRFRGRFGRAAWFSLEP